MRVINRKDFLEMPAGTVYCKGIRWAFESICIKADSLANDWIYLNPAWPSAHDSGEADDLLNESLEAGSSFSCDSDYGRDGCFDESDLFLIFEKDDLLAMRSYIDAALEHS